MRYRVTGTASATPSGKSGSAFGAKQTRSARRQAKHELSIFTVGTRWKEFYVMTPDATKPSASRSKGETGVIWKSRGEFKSALERGRTYPVPFNLARLFFAPHSFLSIPAMSAC